MTDISAAEEGALRNLLTETLKEQRRKRRWGIFFKLIILGYIGYFIYSVNQGDKALGSTQAHTAVIDIKGEIDENSLANARYINKSLNNAFKDSNVRGIILRINSPGGSPVQASYVYDEIMRLKALHKNTPIYAVCSDLCASAAYYIASAADNIYANPSSLVGSIGVLYSGLGGVGLIEKIGVERRLLTAGSQKGFMDPLSPMKPADASYMQVMLDQIHEKFIADVSQGRGKRLTVNENTFSGRVWTGIGAKPIGIIDDFGSAETVARDVIKNENMISYTIKDNLIDHISHRFGASFGHSVQESLLGMKFN